MVPPPPVSSVTRLDGLELIALEPQHAPVLIDLARQRGHPYLLDIPNDPDAVGRTINELRATPWALPLAIVRGDECLGIATTSLANVRALHCSLASLFVDPANASTALALYVRHVFWNFPLRRLHVHVPRMDLTREYEDLYRGIGFVDEGVLRDHAYIAGHAFDVAALAISREEAARWCAEHEPRLVS